MQKRPAKCARTDVIFSAVNAYWECGSVARDCMVAATALPNPMAKMVMPLSLSWAAVAMACASPPYESLCLPSVSTITMRVMPGRTFAAPGFRSSCATRSPSEMLVLPRSSCNALMACVALAAELVSPVSTVAEFAKRTTPT